MYESLYHNPHKPDKNTLLPLYHKSRYCKKLISVKDTVDIISGNSLIFNKKFGLYKDGIIKKSSLYGVVFSGACEVGHRCLIDMMYPTGLLVFDIDRGEFDVDEVKNKFSLLTHDYFDTILCFVSPSGSGLKFVIKPHYIYKQFSQTHRMYTLLLNDLEFPVALRGQGNINRKAFLSLDINVFVQEGFI